MPQQESVSHFNTDAKKRKPRIALYSHDALGLGHMRRNALIAQCLSELCDGAVILLISGAKEFNSMSLAPGIDSVTLPALRKDAAGEYHPRNLDMTRSELTRLRARTIRAALEGFQPDLFIVDKLPRGAFAELDPSLRMLRRRGTKCVLGLRDILDDAATVRREWRESRAERAVASYYHAVWVYGDPTVYDLLSEYGVSEATAEKVRFTGYLDPSHRIFTEPDQAITETLDWVGDSNQLVFCQVGGGQDGEQVAAAFAQSVLPRDACGVILTGPFMSDHSRQALLSYAGNNKRMRVIQHSSEPTHLLRRADKVVGMGGYNTVCEILSLEKSALIVPRTRPRTEQLIRAERMRDLGAVSMMRPEQMNPPALSRWMSGQSDHCVAGIRDRIDFNGLARIPHLAGELLAVA